jgi:outer membrane autotransporter protein
LQGEADTGSASQSVRSAGGVLGVDWQAAPDLRVGLAAGGSESTFSVASLSTSGRMTAGHIGAYAMKTWGAYYVAASLSYARFDNSTTRTITGVGPTETVSGRFDSDQLGVRLELGWRQAYGRVNVTPFVAVEPSVLWQRGYTESGTGILGLTVASHTATSLPTFVGVQFDGRYVMPDGAVLAPYSRVSWVHEFEPDRRVSAAFITAPGASFTVNGARAASDAARLDTGAKLMFNGGLALFASFTGEWSDHTHSYAGSGGFRYVW